MRRDALTDPGLWRQEWGVGDEFYRGNNDRINREAEQEEDGAKMK